jgi:phosphoglycolate phosphatase
MPRFSLFVFDLDGTLVDSRRDLADAANLVLEACGGRPLPEEAIGKMVGEGAANLVMRAFAAAGVPGPDDALDRFLRVYEERLVKHTRPYPQIPELLDALHGRTALAVLTNKPLDATREILSALNLAKYFDREAVVGGDGPFARKPEPEGLRHLVSSAGVRAADTLLIGDSLVDWQTARHAATAICLARYGFGFADFPLEELQAADFSIEAPMELLTL